MLDFAPRRADAGAGKGMAHMGVGRCCAVIGGLSNLAEPSIKDDVVTDVTPRRRRSSRIVQRWLPLMALCSIRSHLLRPGAMEAVRPAPDRLPPVRPSVSPCACALYPRPPKGQSRRQPPPPQQQWIFFKTSLVRERARSRVHRPAAANGVAEPCVRARPRGTKPSRPLPSHSQKGLRRRSSFYFLPLSLLPFLARLVFLPLSPSTICTRAYLVTAPAMTIGSATAVAAAQLNPSCI